MTKKKESRLRGLVTTLEYLPEDVIEQIEQIRFSWVRRRVVEGRYYTGGEVKHPMPVFDLWLEDPPGDPEREPDDHCSSARTAARRLFEYQDWVRFS